jgi:glycosyltransferase involved in cell wall biosynthesis
MGIPEHRQKVLPTGGDAVLGNASEDDKATWRERLDLHDKFVLLYAGSMNENYDFDLLLESARQTETSHPDIHWVFAGNGRCREQVEAAAEELSNVTYAGSYPRDELIGLYGVADVGIVSMVPDPVLDTMMPLKTFDYMAAGLPVIATMRGQGGAVVLTADAGIVLAESQPRLLSDAIRSMYTMDAAGRRNIGQRGQDWILRWINAETMGREVADVVLKTARQPGGSFRRTRRFCRWTWAALQAIADVMTRRSHRAIKQLHVANGEATIQAAFAEWLEHRQPTAATTSSSMSHVLSTRHTSSS